ncbi:uncharacterized protein [Penaeus vannamei]|uniref:uncharacterized protein n=1 Tax=Penaeus vannamei TaxID=6689 RepID=UPI00387F5C3F
MRWEVLLPSDNLMGHPRARCSTHLASRSGLREAMTSRFKEKIKSEVSWSQFGSKKNEGTRNAKFVMRTLAERAIEMQKNLYVIFIDYEKAFDRVKHQEIMNDLQQVDLDDKDLRLLKKSILGTVAAISLEGELSD